ncbi:MAG TPA: response regulator transcription factor [Dehalococcoidia bacterium]
MNATKARSGARILVVDDETQLRRAVRRALEGHGYQVHEAEDGKAALEAFSAFKPDVVLLDLMLPDIGGVEVCARLRELRPTPIIILSVVGDERTKVEALDRGADDYLTKPFGSDELLARIRVALRRSAMPEGGGVFRLDGLEVDSGRRLVALEGEEVHLTPTEYSLLTYLVANAGRVVTHPMILRAVWGTQYADDSHILRTYVNQLRAKLKDDPANPRFIRTDPGVGYRFAEPDPVS